MEPSVRKLVYSHILQTKLEHPRQLTISQREQIISEGLGDREESVREAASKILGGWFDLMLAETNSGVTTEAAVEFLRMFDVIGNAKLAADALLSLFATRRCLTDGLSFHGKHILLHLQGPFKEWTVFTFQTHSGINLLRNQPFSLGSLSSTASPSDLNPVSSQYLSRL